MFHFLHKTYLKYYEMFEYSRDFIICVNSDADDVNYDPEEGKYISGTTTEALLYSKTADEMINHFKSDKKFLDTLALYQGTREDGKLIIYCDPENFNHLVIKMWKTAFQKISAESCYTLYDIARNNALFQTRWNWHDEHDSDPNDYHKKYWHLDKESFIKKFNEVKIFDSYSRFYAGVSMEYLLPLAWNNESSFGSLLRDRYQKIYDKRLVLDINDVKKEIEDYIYDLDEIWPELGRQDYDNFDFEKILKAKPELSFLSSPNFNKAKSIKDLDLPSLIPIIKDYLAWDSGGVTSFSALALYLKHDRMPTPHEIIEHDLSYKNMSGATSAPILTALHVQNKLNMYFVGFFLSIKDKPQILEFST